MTSKITQKTYDEFIASDTKKSYLIKPFYITGKKGSLDLEKIDDGYIFLWERTHISKYAQYCIPEENRYDQNRFFFTSFEELLEELEKQYVCVHHAFCRDACSIYLITSPTEKCAICLKDVQMHMLEETQCQHRFCIECLDNYVKSRMNYTVSRRVHIMDSGIPCPVCRRDLQICDRCDNPQFDCICKCTC